MFNLPLTPASVHSWKLPSGRLEDPVSGEERPHMPWEFTEVDKSRFLEY